MIRLKDPWQVGGTVPIDGAIRRIPPGWLIAIVLLVGVVLYLLAGNIATVLILAIRGVPLDSMFTSLPNLVDGQPGAFLGGNAVGLWVGLGICSLLCARLQTTRPGAFLRLRFADSVSFLLAIIGLIALLPFVMWSGSINELIPLPRLLKEMELEQIALLESVLTGNISILWTLALVAVTPAFCEELFFRGFVQRNLERGTGPVLGIILTGIVFGIFHLRLSQVIPLTILGVYMAYLVWRTGSIWVPITIHFINNGAMVFVARYGGDQGITLASETIEMPWYLVVAGFFALMLCMKALHDRARKLLGS